MREPQAGGIGQAGGIAVGVGGVDIKDGVQFSGLSGHEGNR